MEAVIEKGSEENVLSVDPNSEDYLDSANGSNKLLPFLSYRTPEPEAHMCNRCIDSYKAMFDAGKTTKQFPPDCTGPYSQYKGVTKEEYLETSTEEEWSVYSTINSPIVWAEKELGWVTRGYDEMKDKSMDRWYQRELLDCSARRKILRSGRRIGKTDSLVVNALFMAANNKDYKVLVIAPYEAQVQVFFKRVDELLGDSATLKNKVSRRRSNPEYLELTNGATIKGFCSSASSGGSGGNKIRGQSANYIILDESDYLIDEDMEAIQAILASDSKCILHEASTPTGKRTGFWRRATDKNQGFKEFHYYSHVSPEYTEDVDDFFRANYSFDGYTREFLADFGEETLGVFQKEKILASVGNYTLEESRKHGPQHGWKYVLGADWNGRALGVHMCILGLNPDKEEYRIVDKQIVKQQQFTQDAAIQMMLKMRDYWKVEYMYVDQGYGEFQVETMQKYAYDTGDHELGKILKPIAMGGTRIIKDPITHQEEKKNTKPFCVNLMAQKIERGQVTFPMEEDYMNDDEWGITAEFCGFQIIKIAENGQPKYSREHDHSLTGALLALLAFMENMTDMTKTPYAKIPVQVVTGKSGSELSHEGFKKHQDDQNKRRFSSRSTESYESMASALGPVKQLDKNVKVVMDPRHGPMAIPKSTGRRIGARFTKRSKL